MNTAATPARGPARNMALCSKKEARIDGEINKHMSWTKLISATLTVRLQKAVARTAGDLGDAVVTEEPRRHTQARAWKHHTWLGRSAHILHTTATTLRVGEEDVETATETNR